MPHRRRSLLRGTLGAAPAALILVVACSSDRMSQTPDSAAPLVQAAAPDPAAELDREFQRARTSLNAEAAELATLDRSSREYIARYDTWLREATAAESLRVRRDSVRRTALPPASAPDRR